MGGEDVKETFKELEYHGIISRNVYEETPIRIEYELIKKGKDLNVVMNEIKKWTEKWM